MGEGTPHPPAPITEIGRFGPGREVLSNVLIRTRIGGPPWSLAEAWGYVEGASSAVPSVCRETAPFRRPCPRRRPGPSRSPCPDAVRTSERGGGRAVRSAFRTMMRFQMPSRMHSTIWDAPTPVRRFRRGSGPPLRMTRSTYTARPVLLRTASRRMRPAGARDPCPRGRSRTDADDPPQGAIRYVLRGFYTGEMKE